MMKTIFACGDHPRHRAVARCLADCGTLAALVVENREAFKPVPSRQLPDSTAHLFERHFREREAAELYFFGETPFPSNIPRLDVRLEELNQPRTYEFLRRHGANLLLSYGIHKLSSDLLSSCGIPRRWNIHGGLSPWYRGVITHFWPSYLLEPQMTGMTVHELSQDIDQGDVIHQVGAPLVPGDGLHKLACRAVTELIRELPRLLLATNHIATPHRSSGRIWRSSDWRPEHLHLIYDQYDDAIVDLCLEGKLQGREPNLIRQWN